MKTGTDLKSASRETLLSVIGEQQTVIAELRRRVDELETRLSSSGPSAGMPGNKATAKRRQPETKGPRKRRLHGFARRRAGTHAAGDTCPRVVPRVRHGPVGWLGAADSGGHRDPGGSVHGLGEVMIDAAGLCGPTLSSGARRHGRSSSGARRSGAPTCRMESHCTSPSAAAEAEDFSMSAYMVKLPSASSWSGRRSAGSRPTNVHGRQNRLRDVAGGSVTLGTATLTGNWGLFRWSL